MQANKGKVRDHKHTLERAWTRGYDFIGFSCKNCAYQVEREATPSEKKRIKADQKRSDIRIEAMHKVTWDFRKTFLNEKSEWKYKSYELMTRVRKWAKKHTKDVIVCRIDDSHNASSDLVFILHRIGRELWGTTCYTIAQCDGQPPNEWFMYPGHREGIQKALAEMAKYKRMRY